MSEACATIFHPPTSFTSNIISTSRFAFVPFSAIFTTGSRNGHIAKHMHHGVKRRRYAVTPNGLLEHLVNNRHHVFCRESSQ
jgi:hypothetical protein